APAAAPFPSLAGLILTGGFAPAEQVSRLVDGLGQRLPVIATEHGTFETASAAARTRGLLSTGSQRKLDLARSTFENAVDIEALMDAVNVPRDRKSVV